MSKTLLLADDSVTIQKVVGISFASEDIAIIAVDNGDDAIAKAREEHPDAILADVVMPGKNGYEVCEAIKADPALAHIPVLLLTGTFEAFDADRAERVGAAGHIAKPFESQALVEVVTNLLAKPAPAVAAVADAPAAQPAIAAPAEAMESVAIVDAPGDHNAEAFDFFDDDLEAAEVVAEPESLETDASIDFAPESAFEFGAADLAPAEEAIVADVDPTEDAESVEPTTEIPIAVEASAETELAPIDVGLGSDGQLDVEPELDSVGSEVVARHDAFDRDLSADLSLDSQFEIDSDLGEQISSASELDSSITFGDASEADDSLAPLDASSASIDEPFDFAFESASSEDLDPLGISDAELTPVDADDLAQATTLFPESGSDFDVSSSDLGPVLVNESETTVLLETDESDLNEDVVLQPEHLMDASIEVEPQPEVSADLLGDDQDAGSLATTEPVDWVSPAIDATVVEVSPAEPISEAAEPTFEPTFEPTLEPALEPVFESELDDRSDLSDHAQDGPLADPLADALPDSPLMSSSRPAADMPPASDTAARAEAVLEQIEPQLREQLHDTLEKIAWESFGDLTEAIVRQSVEKVEQIAWEVVPQLIETLVREEIRKMKGEPPSDE